MKEKKQSPLFFLWEVSSKSRFRLVMAAFLVLLSSLCYMGPFYIAYLVIDGIGGGGMAAQEIITLGAYAALFILAQMLFAGIAMTQSHVAAYDMLFDLRVRLAHKLTSLPLGYYSASSSGLIKKS
jgi:ATP-binding cassette subfamily B protein